MIEKIQLDGREPQGCDFKVTSAGEFASDTHRLRIAKWKMVFGKSRFLYKYKEGAVTPVVSTSMESE